MPIRFQVEGTFYDHPKVIGMSDAAFKLWVRAGSYSAAKTTDGFVSENVLVHILNSTADVADELVTRGLWRRRKGGYTFHQWEERNLLKERIEADREADRKRKQKARQNERPNGTPQVRPPNVRPDSNRTPSGIQQESAGIPGDSVSVSVSVSPSSAFRGEVTEVDARVDEPPTRCPKHRDDDNPPPCGACGSARRAREAWDAQQTAAAKQRRTTELERLAQAKAIAVANCDLCDDNGYAGSAVPCDHDPAAAERAARGRAQVAAALARKGSS
jgi:hypothetical protein